MRDGHKIEAGCGIGEVSMEGYGMDGGMKPNWWRDAGFEKPILDPLLQVDKNSYYF